MASPDATSGSAAVTTGGLRQRIRPRHRGRSLARLLAAALLTGAVGIAHLAVAPAHLAEFTLFGVLFIVTGLAEIALAVAIVAAPSPWLFAFASWGTLGVIAVWVMSRTIGLPVGPVAWTPEPAGPMDMLVTLAEVLTLILYLRLIRAPRRAHERAPWRIALVTAPAALLALFFTILSAGAIANPMPLAFNSAPAIPGRPTVSVQALAAPGGPEPVRSVVLTAAPLTVDGHGAYGYNGSVPGPELRVTQGERLQVTLINHLPESTSIHWHGVNVPNSADGVAGITQQAVAPGRSFTYEFVATEPGTYWYHAHQNTSEQLPRGLYGSLVVIPKGGIAQARDYSVLIHSAVGGDELRTNGASGLHLAAAAGESVRLRLTNASTHGFDSAPINPVLLGAPYRVIALDGHDLNQPSDLGPARIRLGMGQRADLAFTMPASGKVLVTGLRAAKAFPWSPQPRTAIITVGEGTEPVAVANPPVFDLTSYGRPAADAAASAPAYDVERTLVLAGSSGFRGGVFDFQETFSGFASPLVPPIRVREGQLVKLHLVNQSAKYHPIHIHGHTFTVLSRNGHPLTGSPVHLDAVLVPPKETWDVAFTADNPGIWMIHCHVLSHAAAGMSMTVNYEGVSTPFSIGVSSGNIPE